MAADLQKANKSKSKTYLISYDSVKCIVGRRVNVDLQNFLAISPPKPETDHVFHHHAPPNLYVVSVSNGNFYTRTTQTIQKIINWDRRGGVE
jgi:hypothetical protein